MRCTRLGAVRRHLLGLAVLPLVLAACGGDGGTGASTVPGSTSTTTGGETTTSLGEVPELTLGPGEFDLEDPRTGLADLDSFVATLTLSFEGSRDGQAESWSAVYEMRHRAAPHATVISVMTTGTAALPDPSWVAEADGARYRVGADGVCTCTRIDPDDLSFSWMEPAGRLDAVLGAEAAGQETIAGILADHFTFDERAVGLFEIAATTGELWVAADGGHLLRYERTTTGDDAYFGEAIEGTLTWEYALTEVNQQVAISFPAGCRVELPMLPDASGVLNLPGWLAFDTAATPAEVSGFYQDELPALGWSVELAPDPSETVAVLQFSRDGENLFIAVGPGEAGFRVDLVVQPAA